MEKIENNQPKEFRREIYLIRHGEREDEAKNSHSEEFETILDTRDKNTNLTEKGDYQSFLTGRIIHMNHLPHPLSIPKEDFIFVLSSPYVRCVQSAIYLSAALKLNERKIYKNKIFIVDNLKEYQNEKNFVGNKILEKAYTELKIPFRLKLEKLKIGPDVKKEVEDAPKSYIRVREFLEVIKNKELKIKGIKPKYIICLTHAFFLLNTMLQYGKVMEANSPIDYCSLNKILLQGDKDELVVVNSNDHLEEYTNVFGERNTPLL